MNITEIGVTSQSQGAVPNMTMYLKLRATLKLALSGHKKGLLCQDHMIVF